MEEKKKKYNEKDKKKNKKKINKIIIFIIVLSITIILIGTYIFIKKKELKNQYIYQNKENLIFSYPEGVDKPIIYLYPKEKIELSVKLGKPENIKVSYPEYRNGWDIIAKPDGTLIDKKTNRKLYALYWEGINDIQNSKKDEGFVIKGTDTINFLEDKLKILGLNEKESEEFIIYWLPKLEKNKYNYIRFATMEEIEEYMPINISKKPDSLIRILMEFKPLDKKIDIKEQILKTPERKGFTVVEWGGTEIR